MGPPKVCFSFRVEPPSDFFIMCWCVLWCFLYASRFPCGCCVHLWGLNHWGLQHCNHLEFTPCRHICLLVMVCGPIDECSEWLLLPLPQVWGPYSTHSTVPQPFQQYGVTYSFGVLEEGYLIPLHSLHRREGSSSVSAPPNDKVNSESVVGVKPSDSGVVIRYQVDEFPGTWSVEHLIAY